MPLSKEDIDNVTLKVKAQAAFDETRGLALRGWVGVIVLTVCLLFVLTYGVQIATGIALTFLAAILRRASVTFDQVSEVVTEETGKLASHTNNLTWIRGTIFLC